MGLLRICRICGWLACAGILYIVGWCPEGGGVGFAVGYGTHVGILYIAGWRPKGDRMGFRFGEVCGLV